MRWDEDAEARGRLVRFVPQVVPPFRRGRPRSQAHYRNGARLCQPAGRLEETVPVDAFSYPFGQVRSGIRALRRGIGEGLMRVSRPALRPLSIGTLLVAAVLGSSILADATPNQLHLLSAHKQSAAAAEATLPTGFPGGLAATSSIPSSTTARLGGSSTSPGTSRRSSSPRPLDRTGPQGCTRSLPHREFELHDDVHVACDRKLAPGRPVAKERPPPDQSGVAANCATRTHENDRGVTSRWHPSNEGTDGPSRLVSGTARPIPMLGCGRLGPEPDGGCGQPSTGRERTPAGLSLPLVPRTVSAQKTGVSRQKPHASRRASHISPMVTTELRELGQ